MEDANPYEPPQTSAADEGESEELYKIACQVAQGTKYPPEAFVFLTHGLEFSKQHIRHQTPHPGHFDAVDLIWCLHDLAMERFGENAREQLSLWKISATRDFGELVYRLVETGHMRSDADESIAEFDNVFDFSNEFKIEGFGTTILIDDED